MKDTFDWQKELDEAITHYVNRRLIHGDRWDDLKVAITALVERLIGEDDVAIKTWRVSQSDEGVNYAAQSQDIKTMEQLDWGATSARNNLRAELRQRLHGGKS